MMQCEKCGAERAYLHKHHRVLRSLGGSNESDNLLALCANCHEDEHGGTGLNEIRRNPELEERRRTAVSAYQQDPERRLRWQAAISTANQRYWSDPATRSLQSARMKTTWTPERRAAQAEVMRRIRARGAASDGSHPNSRAALAEHRARGTANSAQSRTKRG